VAPACAAGVRRPGRINLVRRTTAQAGRPAELLDDYARSAAAFAGVGDYLCLNLSCPNTTDGRESSPTSARGRAARSAGRADGFDPGRPVFLKVKPSNDDGYLRELLAVAAGHGSWWACRSTCRRASRRG
jgi:dihydroorotate dehydrogenase